MKKFSLIDAIVLGTVVTFGLADFSQVAGRQELVYGSGQSLRWLEDPQQQEA